MASRSLQETATDHFQPIFIAPAFSALTLLGLSLHILSRLAIGCRRFPLAQPLIGLAKPFVLGF